MTDQNEKYQVGNFKWCKAGEAVFVMQHYLKNLEADIRNSEVPDNHRYKARLEVDDLIIKIDRRRGSVNFDLDSYLACQTKFRHNEEYRKEVKERIAGTYVDPVKAAKAEAAAKKKAEKEAKKNKA